MENWTFIYKIVYWGEDEKKSITEAGLVLAHTYTDAMKKITTYYGEDNMINVLRLEVMDCNDIIEYDVLSKISWEA